MLANCSRHKILGGKIQANIEATFLFKLSKVQIRIRSDRRIPSDPIRDAYILFEVQSRIYGRILITIKVS